MIRQFLPNSYRVIPSGCFSVALFLVFYFCSNFRKDNSLLNYSTAYTLVFIEIARPVSDPIQFKCLLSHTSTNSRLVTLASVALRLKILIYLQMILTYRPTSSNTSWAHILYYSRIKLCGEYFRFY